MTESIPFKELNIFSNLILDYIHQDDNVREFYKYAPLSSEIEKVIQARLELLPIDANSSMDRKKLAETIKKQYHAIDHIPEQVTQNIVALEESITFCVVTAHQLNIFGGPLYYIYKIAQTISTCKQLSAEYPNYNFVPVYWMGSEDHDFEEINHITLYNKRIQWSDYQKGSLGAYHPDTVLPLLDELQQLLGNVKYTEQLISIFKSAYSQATLSEATRYFVNAIFGEYGLVIVDGDDAVFKRQFIPVIKDDLLHNTSFKLVAQQIEALKEKGYGYQAMPRAINLFYIRENLRERIEFNQQTNCYVILNTELSFSEEEMLNELEQYPERFSPNVILRPLYQQTILPSVAYIGGAGELSYWLQLKLLFDFYGVSYPQLLLRNSVLLVNPNITNKISKLGFSITHFFKDVEELKKDFINKSTDVDFDITAYKKQIEFEFLKLQEHTKIFDATLAPAVGAELQRTLQGLDGVQKRIIKSLKHKNDTELNQLEKIKQQLFPAKSLQERVENFSSYYAVYGPDFIHHLIADFDIYQKEFLLISL